MKGKMMEKMTPAQHKKMMAEEKGGGMAPSFKKGKGFVPAGKGAAKPKGKGRPF